MPGDDDYDPVTARAVLAGMQGTQRPAGFETSSPEPVFIEQSGPLATDEERRAWIEAARDRTFEAGCTFGRASEREGRLLYEGWLERPEDQGPQRWRDWQPIGTYDTDGWNCEVVILADDDGHEKVGSWAFFDEDSDDNVQFTWQDESGEGIGFEPTKGRRKDA